MRLKNISIATRKKTNLFLRFETNLLNGSISTKDEQQLCSFFSQLKTIKPEERSIFKQIVNFDHNAALAAQKYVPNKLLPETINMIYLKNLTHLYGLKRSLSVAELEDIELAYAEKIAGANLKTTLSPKQMKADFHLLVNYVTQYHPKVALENYDLEPTKKEILYQLQTPKSIATFKTLLQRLMSKLHDNHSKIMDFEGLLPIPMTIVKEGVAIDTDTLYFKKGDQILGIGDKDINNVIETVLDFSPKENEESKKFQALQFLRQPSCLLAFNLVSSENKVEIKIKRGSKVLSIPIPLDYIEKFPIEEENIQYDLDEKNHSARIKIKYFDSTSEFKETITNFFKKARKKKISKITIDLKNSPGGKMAGLNYLINYLTPLEYKTVGLKYPSDFAFFEFHTTCITPRYLTDNHHNKGTLLLAVLEQNNITIDYKASSKFTKQSLSQRLQQLTKIYETVYPTQPNTIIKQKFIEKLDRILDNNYSSIFFSHPFSELLFDPIIFWNYLKINKINLQSKMMNALEKFSITKRNIVTDLIAKKPEAVKQVINGFYESLQNNHQQYLLKSSKKEFFETIFTRLKERYDLAKKEGLFFGELEVETSYETESCAALLATILQDNKIANIIGSPPSSAPSFYFMTETFLLPNSRLLAAVSTNKIVRPNVDNALTDHLQPDIEKIASIVNLKK